MTRKDYILLAEALKNARPVSGLPSSPARFTQWSDDCESVADALAAQSRGFDRELFLRNCGVQS